MDASFSLTLSLIEAHLLPSLFYIFSLEFLSHMFFHSHAFLRGILSRKFLLQSVLLTRIFPCFFLLFFLVYNLKLSFKLHNFNNIMLFQREQCEGFSPWRVSKELSTADLFEDIFTEEAKIDIRKKPISKK